MCSYNKVNGTQACSSAGPLMTDLKGRMGFRGFVQSDWGATHASSDLGAGLDMEMPMAPDSLVQGTYFFGPQALAKADPARVDDAAERVVAAALRLDLRKAGGRNGTVVCSPPPCEAAMRAVATSSDHAALARQAAASSVVLLQNAVRPGSGAAPTLPLSKRTCASIAIIGSAAIAPAYAPFGGRAWNKGDYYSGGGSGHVVASPSQLLTAFDGIEARARIEGLQVLNASSDDVYAATHAASKVDVAVVVVGTTSGEAEDRSSLRLDNGADDLVAAVARAAKRTVVLVMTPGAFLTPWRGQVDALACLFLGGQGSGGAFADVLFADVPPMGRLPIMLPATEDDTIPPTPCCLPGQSGTVQYAEGLYTSYRNPAIFPAFPFGFGLSYTKFDFGKPAKCSGDGSSGGEGSSGGDGSSGGGRRGATAGDVAACFTIAITNVGGAPGAEVCQLYVTFPPAARQPPVALLKGFAKTKVLQLKESQTLTFQLTRRDVSYFSVEESNWVVAESLQGHFRTSSSAQDTRQSVGIKPSCSRE